ncbi:Borealin-lik [Pyrenophora seminiperda CCB06]|uniref:Borealin-lik n=1 Tax=Pyrenophora seminiperda CCB06 TaxID=1302712 RepID=A0A3M7LX98_9PLEO|nr:Borealin-lik [Pyrenophora seminiperda CCB06]
MTDGITADIKMSMIQNTRLEIEARIEKLRAMCNAQAASMQSRLERRVNRVPVVTRQTTLEELLKASAPAKPMPTKKATATATKASTTTTKSTATSTKSTTTSTKSTTTTTATKATATRKTRAAPTKAVTSSSSGPASAQEERVKPTVKAIPAYAKPTKNTRAKKRGSDETSGEDKAGEDKENTDLPVPKKRARTIAQKPAAPTATVRSTRAASRTKPADATAHVLSPKTDAANVRKPAARSARPR